MYAYPDHNFLIDCLHNPEWRKSVLNAHRSGIVRLVLSPWHFYEYGNARAYADTEALIQFAEELQPNWTMERLDLQSYELWIVWRQIWERSTEVVEPIGTLDEIMGVLSRVKLRHASGVTVRDFIAEFSTDRALDQIQNQVKVTASNQLAYEQGRFTDRVKAEVTLRHVAITRARLELKNAKHETIHQRATALLLEQPIAGQLRYFVDSGFVKDLKCYQVEHALTEDLYQNGGKFSVNKFVDRQHATIALPYCDCFVTTDGDLIRRCHRIKQRLPFATAEVIRGEDFICMLNHPRMPIP